ncbi:MAG: heparinase II/III domain-containing protein [Candidatus Aminicenantales bacterium]
MNRARSIASFFLIAILGLAAAWVVSAKNSKNNRSHLEPFVYQEDFEEGELNAWASYPPNQDTAYDPYVYPGPIRPDEPGLCLIVRAEPPWSQDQLLGAVKLMDFILAPNFSLSFRYFIKALDRCQELTVHLPLADGRRLIYRWQNPRPNEWTEMKLTWEELQAQGLVSEMDKDKGLRPTAVAITVRILKADPSCPIHFGLDDIQVCALRPKSFSFLEPEVTLLGEWQERIARRHLRPGETFRLRGTFGFEPDRASLIISEFTDRNYIVLTGQLKRDKQGVWKSEEIFVSEKRWPPGLYLGTITAWIKDEIVSETKFTLFVVPVPGKSFHPRLLFSPTELGRFRERLLSPRFKSVLDRFLSRARSYREQINPEKLVFDINQFPDRDWLASLPAWYRDRLMAFREALFTNAIAHLSGRDEEAGGFIQKLLLELAAWPQWNHPWMEARGFHTYYPVGEFAEAFAVAYDAVYEILSEEERQAVRSGLLRNYIEPAYRTYVVDNQVTSNSSNWISHIAGGALLSLMAIAWDDPSLGDLEPWLTGFILKEHKYITTVFGRDGSYGEGFRYYNFAMQSFAKTVPALKRIFHLDLSAPFLSSHQETLWASIAQKNIAFGFGDTESYLKQEAMAWWIGGENGPMNNWAWLLELSRDATLAWLYQQLKEFDTLQEVLHETSDIEAERPDQLGDVRFFPEVGTVVFKSGWREDDFIFVFRSGPFFNHQHMDQGSFYLADHGEIFLEERYDGEHHYYDDPVYRSHAIQAISHNTILLNRNPQSQKVGDPKGFAPGMNDQARLVHWLDGPSFAFAAGRLEKVYVDEIRLLRRNLLYIKPRAVLLIDEIVPGQSDIEVNRLFHSRWKKDISPGTEVSKIRRGEKILHLFHLAPENAVKEVLTEPHFLCQYSAMPLVERGYLEVSRRTEGRKLIFADLITATREEVPPPFKIEKGDSFVLIHSSLNDYGPEVALNLDSSVALGEWSSDALLLAKSFADGILVVGGTILKKAGMVVLELDQPFYGRLDWQKNGLLIGANQEKETAISLRVPTKPGRVVLNGRVWRNFRYDSAQGVIHLLLPAGPTQVQILNR